VHSKKILISLASSFRWVQISHKFPVSRRLPSSEVLQLYGAKEAITRIFFPINKVRPRLDTFPIEGQYYLEDLCQAQKFISSKVRSGRRLAHE
jgi:hypothetical protein